LKNISGKIWITKSYNCSNALQVGMSPNFGLVLKQKYILKCLGLEGGRSVARKGSIFDRDSKVAG